MGQLLLVQCRSLVTGFAQLVVISSLREMQLAGSVVKQSPTMVVLTVLGRSLHSTSPQHEGNSEVALMGSKLLAAIHLGIA